MRFIVTVKEVCHVTYIVEADSADSIEEGDLLEYVNSDAIDLDTTIIEPIELVSVEEYKL